MLVLWIKRRARIGVKVSTARNRSGSWSVNGGKILQTHDKSPYGAGERDGSALARLYFSDRTDSDCDPCFEVAEWLQVLRTYIE